MARVRVLLPSLLSSIAAVPRERTVEARTVRGAIDALFEGCPALKFHLVAEDGRFRQHVLCYVNDTDTRWIPDLAAAPVADGDVLRFVQAVSGG